MGFRGVCGEDLVVLHPTRDRLSCCVLLLCPASTYCASHFARPPLTCAAYPAVSTFPLHLLAQRLRFSSAYPCLDTMLTASL